MMNSTNNDGFFNIDFETFLGQIDIVFERPIENGYNGLPVGNGDIGAVVWTPKNGNILRIVCNKCDLLTPGGTGNENFLPISAFQLDIAMGNTRGRWSKEDTCRTSLSLWKGCVNVNWNKGKTSHSARIFAEEGRNILHIVGSIEGCNTQIKLTRWKNKNYGTDLTFHQLKGKYLLRYKSYDGSKYVVALDIEGAKIAKAEVTKNDINLYISRAEYHLALSVVTSGESADVEDKAMSLLKESFNDGLEILEKRRLKFWMDFWDKSFVDIGHEYANRLYYFYLYQIGACSRGNYIPKFNGGLWTWHKDKRAWGGPIWFLNQSRIYQGIYQSNHLELGKVFFENIYAMLPEAKKAARDMFGIDGAYFCEVVDKTGRPSKGMHPDMYRITSSGVFYALMFWECYLYTLDEAFLKERAYPILREACRFYENYITRDGNGNFHIGPSMAFETRPVGYDSVPDIAAIKVGFNALIEASKILNFDEKHRGKWKDIIDRVVDYPVEEDGTFSYIRNKEGKPVNSWQDYKYIWQVPNFANIFPVWDIDEQHPLYKVAVNTYNKLKYYRDAGHGKLAIVAARLGLKDEMRFALWHHINSYQWFEQGHMHYSYKNQVDEDNMIPYLEPEGIYMRAVNDMLLQSRHGIIKVFPAFPELWDGNFELLAERNIKVSSRIEKGRVRFIGLRNNSNRKQTIYVKNPWSNNAVGLVQKDEVFNMNNMDLIKVVIDSGEEVLLKLHQEDLHFLPVRIKGNRSPEPRMMGAVYTGGFRGLPRHDTEFNVW